MRSSVRLLVLAQTCLWLFLFVCFLTFPYFLLESDEGGISNYGVYDSSVVPYTLAFGLCGLLTLQAARVLPAYTLRRRQLWRVLVGFGWLCLFVLESTYLYQVGDTLDAVHIVAGIALFVFESASALWLGRAYTRDRLQTALIAVQLLGFVLALLTFAGLLHVLFVAEVVTGLSFGMLLVRATRQAIAGVPFAKPALPGNRSSHAQK